MSAPANKKVFAQLPKQQAEKLGELVKKHSLADLEDTQGQQEQEG
ncbi:hypothetical protein P7H25_09220 [Paenibacillus larvae]|nr:hypothetical protein [Paenibacillus larvae]MDT2255784.1 hypothetical protein [Paenibacillus larvae]